ncbi:UNVERIFIED_CONTAM: protein CASP [Sesamum latifolium]|uniref:Protein CASP n=1 Tax=Sesamum latifolium TaxID=2727402 RepID=A0AAW2WX28_9LAMI
MVRNGPRVIIPTLLLSNRVAGARRVAFLQIGYGVRSDPCDPTRMTYARIFKGESRETFRSARSQGEREKSNSSSSATPVSAVATFWKGWHCEEIEYTYVRVTTEKEKKRFVVGITKYVISLLSDFDLEKERTILDEQGLRIAENQENSQKNRRKLAESTRDFKKASNEEKLVLFNSLLKGYQEEVDKLTKRAKFGENAFLNIYQKLYEAPDPYPVLTSIAEKDAKLSEIESENRKMKVELEEFRTESTHLKNQQATIRRLEERTRQLEQQMEEKVKEIVDIKQRNLAEENQKTMEVLREKVPCSLERMLQDQLRQAQESVSTMRKLHEFAQSQLFELRAQSEEERAAKQSEVNLLMDEVEQAQTRLLSLEREKGLLRSQLQSVNEESGHKKSDNSDANTMLENSLSAKEKIISELNMELHNIETTLSNEREYHLNELKKLKTLLNEKELELEELKKELQARPTEKLVDDLRKKLKILQAVGYNSIEAEDWEAATSGEEMSKMESLLLDKNRKMEHELTQFKVKIAEKSSLLEAAEVKIRELTEQINEQQRLIQKLEDDILKGYSSNDKKGSFFYDWDLSESGGTNQLENAEQRRAPSDLDQSSMLKVICNQRDRFRARLRETEEEIRKLNEKIGMLMTELEKTKADNVKLYGKIRYVQDYNSEKVISRGSKKIQNRAELLFIISTNVYKKIGKRSKVQGTGVEGQNNPQQWTVSSRQQSVVNALIDSYEARSHNLSKGVMACCLDHELALECGAMASNSKELLCAV